MYRVQENYVNNIKIKDLRREYEELEWCSDEIKCELK